LQLKQINIVQFKNLENLEFTPHPNINAFVGLNGMGKTNILDAIHYLCLSKSNFTRIEKNNILFGCDFFRLKGIFDIDNSENEFIIKFKINTNKVIEHNKKALDKITDHIGKLPVVIITPNDKNDLLENSSYRRNFMNKALSQTNRRYLDALVEYNKLLHHRNAYLKSTNPNQADVLLLETYDHKMHPLVLFIMQERQLFIEKIKTDFFKSYNDISEGKETPDIDYVCQMQKDDFLVLTKQNLHKDIILKRSTVGIHKDDLVFSLDDTSLKQFGSQGQLKSFLLSIRLAEFSFLKIEKKINPILILDDIFDKLDKIRLKKLVSMLFNKQFGQVFISDTDLTRIKSVFAETKIDHRIFEIEEGKIINTYD
jgi:DNA replication and repair protein RecF